MIYHNGLKEERDCCFALIVFLMSCFCLCYVTLPHGVVGWYVVCDIVFPDHTRLPLCISKLVCSNGNNYMGELIGIQTALQHLVEQHSLKRSIHISLISGL